ncbi:MAG: hypothetical protein GQ526_08375 [Ardenticatenales bacterium]|nr:hypothetical protein [Ardenticatenales bacterium]
MKKVCESRRRETILTPAASSGQYRPPSGRAKRVSKAPTGPDQAQPLAELSDLRYDTGGIHRLG